MFSFGRVRGPLVRAAIIAGGAVVLSAVAIGGGLLLAGDDPDVPSADDVHTAAPECGTVPEEAVAGAVPDAIVESVGTGPLPGGESTMCSWTSLGRSADPGVLRVELSALFSDTSRDTPLSGTEHAEQTLTALMPERSEVVALPEGIEGHVWRERSPGTADLAFHTDNLLVRVSYAGAFGNDPVGSQDARDLTVRVAEQFVEAL